MPHMVRLEIIAHRFKSVMLAFTDSLLFIPKNYINPIDSAISEAVSR
jgi:hypothetical protein